MLQKELEGRVQAYAEYDAATAPREAEPEPEPKASPPKGKGKKGAAAEEFVPQIAVGAPAATPVSEPVWCIRDARGIEPLAHAAERASLGERARSWGACRGAPGRGYAARAD